MILKKGISGAGLCTMRLKRIKQMNALVVDKGCRSDIEQFVTIMKINI